MESSKSWNTWVLAPEVKEVLENAPKILIPSERQELIDLSLGGKKNDYFEVRYDLNGKKDLLSATVARCKNGVAVNYPDPYMRRRDPDSMLIADDKPTDKPHYRDKIKKPFKEARAEILDWLKGQELVVMPFRAGKEERGCDAILICPANAAFFATALADIQGLIKASELKKYFVPRGIIFVAPPFRETLCEGKQIVIHNREDNVHEVFSLNLYLGPSAKKGVYSMLLDVGEQEGWLTAHASAVQITTPYDNIFTIMHEGASGGGKSEMLEYPHRQADGLLKLAENTVTGEKRVVALSQGCTLSPISDDMALCYPGSNKRGQKKLVISDAEDAWFMRVDQITEYGINPNLEKLCINPKEPFLFLNLDGIPGSTCLLWDHTEDEPGKPCPNPRVVLPRRSMPDAVSGQVEIDVRSLGLRCPPCTQEKPTFGILGMMHIIPPALAWLWRLAVPRGHANPSIVSVDSLKSEGVGSFWPFATGTQVSLANLLLTQIAETPDTNYAIFPNCHIGAWKVGFMSEWVCREYLARRGLAKFRQNQVNKSRCPLLGYTLDHMTIENIRIPRWLLQVERQSEVGIEGYDEGAKQLQKFFVDNIKVFLESPKLDPLGRKILECFMDNGEVEDYHKILPGGWVEM